jgi:hypothetical protein
MPESPRSRLCLSDDHPAPRQPHGAIAGRVLFASSAAGLATRETMEEIHARMRAWPEHPGAFATLAHCEAVARKTE